MAQRVENVITSIYVIEASVSTIILFCVIHEDFDDLYQWQTFRPSSFHQRQISSLCRCYNDERYWVETSPIYINHQHLRRLHNRKLLWERSPRSHKNISSNRFRHTKTSRALRIDVAGTPLKLLINDYFDF